MTIKVGDRLPDSTFKVMTGAGPANRTTAEIFAGKTVVGFSAHGVISRKDFGVTNYASIVKDDVEIIIEAPRVTEHKGAPRARANFARIVVFADAGCGSLQRACSALRLASNLIRTIGARGGRWDKEKKRKPMSINLHEQ